MRVTITEAVLKDADPSTGTHYDLTQGDSITVPEAVGAYWCRMGWAEDASGEVPKGERIEGAREPLRHEATDTAEHPRIARRARSLRVDDSTNGAA